MLQTMLKPPPKRRNGTSKVEPRFGIPPALTTDIGVLYAADCMDVLSAIRDGSIDTVFADPPFNLAKDYGSGAEQDDLHRDDYLRWCYGWIDECVRVIKPGGAIFIYILPQWGFHFAAHLEQRGMLFRHWIA